MFASSPALIDEELQILLGNWKGSLYGPTGARWDWYLFLDRDGRYESTKRLDPDKSWTNHGAWSFDPAERVLELRPETPGHMGLEEERWRVLSVEECEDSNVVLVLYRIVLANRNLPIMLYRVHDQGRGYGTDWEKRLDEAAGALDDPA